MSLRPANIPQSINPASPLIPYRGGKMSETAEAADGQAVQYPASGETYSEYPEQYYEQPEAPRSFMQKLMANKIVLVGTPKQTP